MSEYKPTIGLEVHAELNTRTKMFCDCKNDPDPSALLGAGVKHPNVNVCPVCLGHPGALPVADKQAVEAVVKVGLAIGAKINAQSKFDRKNYFYPDLPKGYQISQYDAPIVQGGELMEVAITRIHLEEDAGKLMHAPDGKSTLVDFNRAGVPLMELVTEPCIKSAEEAVRFMKELQLLLRYLGVSDADLERGQMRADANVSISSDPEKLGTRAEIKNLNSFRAVADAITYEITRQAGILEQGEKVHQETRGWDEAKKKTVSQRSKEEAHDYRYFPEPDLSPFAPAEIFDLEDMRRHLPELPRAKQARFEKEFGLSEKQAGMLVETKELAEFFEEALSELAERDKGQATGDKMKSEHLLFNYLTSDLVGLLNESGSTIQDSRVNPEHLAHLVDLIADGKIMSRQAKDILEKMVTTGEDPEDIMKNEGLETVSDESELDAAVKIVLEENPAAVADYKKGKTASMQFLIGKAMTKLNGRGNPERLREILTNLFK